MNDGDGLLRGRQAAASEDLRERALERLSEGHFDLLADLVDGGDTQIATLVENLRIYQAELEIQRDELLESRARTEETLARFTSFFHGLSVAELVINENGLISDTNLTAQQLFGLRDAHLRHHFMGRLIDEGDRARVAGIWSHLRPGHSLSLAEIRFRSGGSGFIGDLHIAPLPGPSDHPTEFICAVIDRSEAVRQRIELHQTSERLRLNEATLRHRLKEVAALHDVLAETSHTEASIQEILQRVVDRLPAAWQFPELAQAQIELPDLLVATARFQRSDWEQTAEISVNSEPLGVIRIAYPRPPLIHEGAVFLDEEQSLLNAIATHVSVFLVRRRDEERLIDTRERYRVLAEFSSDWEYWLGPDGHYLYVSPACERLVGYGAEEFMADPELFSRLVSPSDRAAWLEHHQHYLEFPGEDGGLLELRLIGRQGEECCIEHSCNPVFADDGRYLGRRGVNRDVTERKRFEVELKRSEDFLNTTGRMAKVGGWELDPSTDALSWTRGTGALFGLPSGAARTLDEALGLCHPSDRPRLREAMDRARQAGEGFDLQVRLGIEEARPIWVQVTCEPVLDHGRATKLIGAVQDVSARVETEKALRQTARVFESTAEGVMITDHEDRILAVNPAFSGITGFSEGEVLGEPMRMLFSGRHDQAFDEEMHERLSVSGQWQGELWTQRKDGEVYPVLLTLSAVADEVDDLTHYVGVFRDITEMKRSEEKLARLAHHDALTGLPNRALFQERLAHCIQRAARYRRQVGLLFLDLDRFKMVNDTLGHAVGDALLKEVAAVLSHEVRAVDTIARLGGDEFVVILEDIQAPRFAATFAQRVLEVFSQPFNLEGHELFVTASIGISLYPQDGEDIDSLLRHADIAMYQAKTAGRNGFCFFEAAMSEGAIERLRLEQDLRLAVQRNELELLFQPQVALDTQRLRGVEVLCRWNHPSLGVIPPAQFIPLAEEIGVIDAIGGWVLEQSFKQLAAWDSGGFEVPRLAINLSIREIEQKGLLPLVEDLLERYRITPSRIELEVTETTIMRRTETAIQTLKALRALGVTLAVDDFGTGYSSLAYLKRLPLSRLKIDRSFVERIDEDANDDAIARAIIGLARSLGLEVLAEGIETRKQVDFLYCEGCSEGQGHLFSRPVTAEALAANWTISA